MTGSKRHMRQEVKIAWVISPKASALGSRWIQASWAEGGWPGQEEGPSESEKPDFVIQGVRKREKLRLRRTALILNMNTDVVKLPLSFCRADCGFGARRPEFKPWLCHSLAVWPWANYWASQKPSILTSKIRVNSNYMFSCLTLDCNSTWTGTIWV